METNRRILPGGLGLGAVILVALLFPSSSAGQHVVGLIPGEVGGFTLEEVDLRGPAAARTVYRAEGEPEVWLVLAHGELALQLHQMIRSQMEGEAREIDIGGRSFISAESTSELMVLDLSDDVLFAAGGEIPEGGGDDFESTVLDFLEEFDPRRALGWSPPQPAGATEAAPSERLPDQTERAPESPEGEGAERMEESAVERPMAECGGMDCFRSAVRRCRPARVPVEQGPRVRGVYRVEGRTEDGGCRISFRFTENPNPDYEERPLSFALGPRPDFTEDLVREALRGCLEGSEQAVEEHACEGPLVGIAGGGN